MGRNVSQNHPPTGGNGGLLLGFYCCVYHIHVHIAAHLVLEDDDVLQAHDLLATHQVPTKIRERRQSFPTDWSQGATAAKCSEVWGCGQVSLPANVWQKSRVGRLDHPNCLYSNSISGISVLVSWYFFLCPKILLGAPWASTWIGGVHYKPSSYWGNYPLVD